MFVLALHKNFWFTHMMFWVQMFYLFPWLTVKCQWSTLCFKLLCLFCHYFFLTMRVGQKCSRDHCECGLGKMPFQVSRISVLSDQIVRWLTDKQAGACRVWVISHQALRLSWQVGVRFSALFPRGLEQIFQGVFKNSGQLGFPWQADCAEEHCGTLPYPRAQGSPACWAVGLSVCHLSNEAAGVAWTLHWCKWKWTLGGWKRVTLLLGVMGVGKWESLRLPITTQMLPL